MSLKNNDPMHVKSFLLGIGVIVFSTDTFGMKNFFKETILSAQLKKCEAPNDYGYAPLHIAAIKGYDEVVEILIAKGQKANAETKKEKLTALHFAAKNGSCEIVNLLLSHGADIDACDKKGTTPLHCASSHGHVEVVRLLIKKGAGIQMRDGKGNSPLHKACLKGRYRVCQVLMSYGADIEATNRNQKTPINVAEDNGHMEVGIILKKLCQEHKDRGYDLIQKGHGHSPLYNWASSLGLPDHKLPTHPGRMHEYKKDSDMRRVHEEVCRAAIMEQADFLELRDSRGRTCLDCAMEMNAPPQAMKILLECGASFNRRNLLTGGMLIHRFAERGYVDLVGILISKDCSQVFVRDNHGRTPLYCAADKKKNTVMVKLLLEAGADVHARDDEGMTPLDAALKGDTLAIIEMLLSYGAYSQNRHCGKTPIHVLIEKGDVRYVELFLQNGRYLDIPCNEILEHSDAHNRTSLDYAVERGDDSIILLLSEHGALPGRENPKRVIPLQAYIEKGDIEQVERLSRKIMYQVHLTDANGRTPLHDAVCLGSIEIVGALLAAGAFVDAADKLSRTPLFFAISKGFLEIAKALIEAGASVNYSSGSAGRTPLDIAKENGHTPMVKILMEAEASVRNEAGFEMKQPAKDARKVYELDTHSNHTSSRLPIHLLAEKGDIEHLKQLASRESDRINVQDSYGHTALHYASNQGQLEMVTVLLGVGAQVNSVDKLNTTPLHLAVRKGCVDVVRVLIHAGADPNILSSYAGGCTALGMAVEQGNTEIAQILISAGARTSQKNAASRTLLHVAGLRGHKDMALLLVEVGADISAKDSFGATSVDLALQKGLEKTAKLLQDTGAKAAFGAQSPAIATGETEVPEKRAVIDILDQSEEEEDVVIWKQEVILVDDKAAIELKSFYSKCGESMFTCRKNEAGIIIKMYGSYLLLLVGYSPLCYSMDVVLTTDESNPVVVNTADKNKEKNDNLVREFLYCSNWMYDRVWFCEHTWDTLRDLLLQDKSRIAMKDSCNNTLLHIAAAMVASMGEYYDEFEFLINSEANIDAVNSYGDTPLHTAIRFGQNDGAASLLIKYGANINARNCFGSTPVHLAALHRREWLFEFLCSGKCRQSPDMRIQDCMGDTVLHYGVSGESLKIIENIIKYDSGVIDIKNKCGRIPLQNAVGRFEMNDEEIRDRRLFAKELSHCYFDHYMKPPICERHPFMGRLLVQEGACHFGDVSSKLIMPLLNAGAAKYKQSLMHYAAAWNLPYIVEVCINGNADFMKACDNHGRMPIHWAAEKGHVDVVKLFLERGGEALMQIPDKWGRMPIHYAAENGHLEVVRLFLERGGVALIQAKSDQTKKNALHYAAQAGHAPVFELLFSVVRKIPSYQISDTLLRFAIRGGNAEIVDSLIQAKPDLIDKLVRLDKDDRANTELHYASEKGLLHLVVLLVEKGADLKAQNEDHCTPITLAERNGHNLVCSFLRFTKEKRKKKFTSFHWAAIEGQDSIIDFLKLINAQGINKPSVEGLAPLHYAAKLGNCAVIMKLKECGAMVNMPTSDKLGMTPLHLAVVRAHESAVEVLLLECGANSLLPDELGKIPLHYASENGYLGVVRILLKEDYVAAGSGSEMPKLQLIPGKKANTSGYYLPLDKSGKRPIDYAAENGHRDIVSVLNKKIRDDTSDSQENIDINSDIDM